ncbi:MAG: glutathione S-transferase family protein [Sphingomonadaceae bacterium]|nr:glutathione S-transferase family protein [Sphingomonadaceae bacterium]
MANYTFFTHPMSRSQIARWALQEVGADYEDALVDFRNKPEALLKINPMGKLPTLVHHANGGDRVVSEAAAICAYLAEMHPESGLLPTDEQKADYLRWMFFAAGPVDQAITAKALGFDPVEPEQQGMAGWGNFERTTTTLEWWLADRAYVCGPKFTMADVYVGSLVDWGLNFGTIPPKEAFVAYAERIQQRPAYKDAKKIDNDLIEKMKK